jgi:hypothetical protein
VREPKRLLAGDATSFERQLLSAVKDERPSPELALKMQQALGLSGAGASLAPALAVKAGHALWLKLGAVAIAGGGLVATAAVLKPQLGTGVEEAAQVTPPAQREAAAVSAQPALEVAQPLEESATLREEIELLDAVRALVARGERASALEALARYEARFPGGALEREAGVLRRRLAPAGLKAATGR